MKDPICISYRRLLLMIFTICSLGMTGCSSLDAGSGKFHSALIGKVDSNEDEDVVGANRDWYQMNH
ncbi:MAG TPA: hypothetical protein VE242_07505 [Chthoniobacterales bacterium]|nr:hypothetical protein [Chthoniobacterales bacterium]